MPHKTYASQMSLVVLLMLGGLMLCLPVAAMKGWGYISVTDTFGSVLKLKVPAGMISETDTNTGLLTLGTSAQVIDDAFQDIDIANGELGIALGALPVDLVQSVTPDNQAVTPQVVLDALMTQMENAVESLVFTSSKTLILAGHSAARISGTSTQGDALVIVVDLGDAYLLATAVTAAGEQPLFEPLILSIIESAEYTP